MYPVCSSSPFHLFHSCSQSILYLGGFYYNVSLGIGSPFFHLGDSLAEGFRTLQRLLCIGRGLRSQWLHQGMMLVWEIYLFSSSTVPCSKQRLALQFKPWTVQVLLWVAYTEVVHVSKLIQMSVSNTQCKRCRSTCFILHRYFARSEGAEKLRALLTPLG